MVLLLVVWPNVMTVVELHAKYELLKETNQRYTQTIANIHKHQEVYAARQTDIVLLHQAIPPKVQSYQIVSDVQKIPSRDPKQSNVQFGPYALEGALSGVKSGEEKKSSLPPTYDINLSLQGTMKEIYAALDVIAQQRRLKTIKSMILQRSKEESSPTYTAQLVIEVYYQ